MPTAIFDVDRKSSRLSERRARYDRLLHPFGRFSHLHPHRFRAFGPLRDAHGIEQAAADQDGVLRGILSWRQYLDDGLGADRRGRQRGSENQCGKRVPGNLCRTGTPRICIRRGSARSLSLSMSIPTAMRPLTPYWASGSGAVCVPVGALAYLVATGCGWDLPVTGFKLFTIVR